MLLNYSEHKEFRFSFWITYEENQFGYSGKSKPLITDEQTYDINSWLGETVGDIGITWGFEFKNDQKPSTFSTKMWYESNPKKYRIWKFLNKDDAMLFKMKWGGK